MKERLDVLMVQRAACTIPGKRRKRIIMAGDVYVDGQKEDKAGTMFPETVKIEVRGQYTAVCQQGRTEAGKSHEEL